MVVAHSRLQNYSSWESVLLAAERTAAAMNAEIDEQDRLLASLEAQSDEPAAIQQLQAKVEAHLAGNNERTAKLRQLVEAATTELWSVENDCRSCCEQITSLSQRVQMICGE